MCTKIKYSTSDDAEYAAAKLIIENWLGNRPKAECAVYRCPDCGKFHLSSKRGSRGRKDKFKIFRQGLLV